jgi:hypothetical protein
MTILAALPALLFGLACLSAVAVLALSGRRAIAAWVQLGSALKSCSEVRTAKVTIIGNRPQLRLVEGGIRRPAGAPRHGLRAAA